jgi:SpoVK/Ycf46/Vps4 family AAA+-type ATPase
MNSNDLSVLIRSRVPILVIDSADETQVIKTVLRASGHPSEPAELIRKGRFDEIFFVDLPQLAARLEILRIHVQRRHIALDAASLMALAQASEGFSGAEIEQAIVAVLYTAHAQHVTPNMDMIRNELVSTRPLAVVMAEKVASLRAWAQERTVPAD